MPLYSRRGAGGPCFWLDTAHSFVANGYVGVGDDGASTINVNIVPWVAPCNGTLLNMRVQGLTNANSTVHITIYKASASSNPSYASTALTTTVSFGSATGSDTTHSVSVSGGDMVVAFSDAVWNVNGAAITCQFVPT